VEKELNKFLLLLKSISKVNNYYIDLFLFFKHDTKKNIIFFLHELVCLSARSNKHWKIKLICLHIAFDQTRRTCREAKPQGRLHPSDFVV